ncbi:MAG: polysaccharide biosynthesis protein [Ruminococcaceae bacterium]|nr:polysaccharide biosynthesis protein [Oscillospiraceae bacterium]
MLDFFEKLKYRKLMLLAIDAIATLCLSVLCVLLLGKNVRPLGLLVLFACVYVMRTICGIYRQIVRYSSLGAYMRLVLADFLGGLLYLALAYALLPQNFRLTPWLALSLVATGCLLTLCERFLYQYIYRYLAPHHAEKSTACSEIEKFKCAIIGAGTNGYYLADELKASKSSLYTPCCFIDNDKEKIGKKVNDLNVYSPQKATEILRKLGVTHVIVAIPERNAARRQELFDLYSKRGFKVMIYEQPFSEESTNMLASYDTNQKPIVRDFKIEDLLFRDPIQINDEKTSAFYRGKTILITGGGGSIGSEICRQLAKFAPKRLIVLDIYENNAYDIQQELKLKYGGELDLEVEIASVREPERVDEVMATYRPDIVVHAAAHKHVPLMEHNCAEAIKNNVFGTLHVVNAAEKHGVKKFIMISTDKAVNPTNVMGASKRMCEMIVQSREGSATEFTAVRFGNVLGSNGSVIPLFRRQIANGGPVTITDFRIIRYFMTIPEAAQLVLEAGAMAKNGELYVLDMGKPVKILQLAEDMIRMSGFEPYRDIDIQEIGLREGEKLYEELLVKTEELDKTENDMIFVERDKGLTRNEVADKLQTLAEAAANGTPAIVKRAMKQVVDTYHDPDEVNKNAEQTEEMKTAAMAE